MRNLLADPDSDGTFTENSKTNFLRGKNTGQYACMREGKECRVDTGENWCCDTLPSTGEPLNLQCKDVDKESGFGTCEKVHGWLPPRTSVYADIS